MDVPDNDVTSLGRLILEQTNSDLIPKAAAADDNTFLIKLWCTRVGWIDPGVKKEIFLINLHLQNLRLVQYTLPNGYAGLVNRFIDVLKVAVYGTDDLIVACKSFST